MYSHNPITIDFDTSSEWKENGLLVGAEVRFFRDALDADKIAALEAMCNLSEVQLELSISSPDNGAAVVPESTVALSKEKLQEPQPIVFKNVTRQYRHWIKRTGVSLSLTMGGVCRGVSPAEFGVSIGYRKEALIVGYYNKQDHSWGKRYFTGDREMNDRMNKREVRNASSLEYYSPITSSHRRCKLYNYRVSILRLPTLYCFTLLMYPISSADFF